MSRVRLIGHHPEYGFCFGPYVRKYMHASFKKKFGQMDPIQYAPLFKTWPTWKRLLWMAKFEGKWQISCFREPRHADMRKSLYGQMFKKHKVAFPQLVKKPKPKKVEAPKPGKAMVVVGNPWRVVDEMQAYVLNAGGLAAQIPGQPGNPQAQAQMHPGVPQAYAEFQRQIEDVVERNRQRQAQAANRNRRMYLGIDENEEGPF